MHDNTMTTRNGRQPVMGGNAAFKWNLRMMLMLAMLACPMLSAADEAQPFDCTMPIILKPLLEDIQGKIAPEKNRTPWQHFKCPRTTYYFDVKTDKTKDGKLEYDKIMDVSYECPSRHIFRLFIKDGLVMRLEHTEPSGEVHAYSQTIMNKLDKLHFADETYTLLSKECNLAICKGECLWLLLPDGRHQADFDVKVAISMMKLDFIGEMSLPQEHMIYKFCFWDRFMKNASMLYTGEERSSRLKNFHFTQLLG